MGFPSPCSRYPYAVAWNDDDDADEVSIHASPPYVLHCEICTCYRSFLSPISGPARRVARTCTPPWLVSGDFTAIIGPHEEVELCCEWRSYCMHDYNSLCRSERLPESSSLVRRLTLVEIKSPQILR
ncbi:hypothetical protein MUK42_23877 [Musa troglodytarum]|uniref:Uncharacterized protein n=1 Tax=Musa troglodytarum TaxID=320322 RepID=A0A9E7EM94_9LILI|nr:hypothetical protein MUK42_23877 [Musa troglodytarum]